MLLSFIVPVASYHEHLIGRARAQVEKQTIPCAFIPVIDHDAHGAGWARNRGVERAETPFIAFLDCDDYLDPTFAEKMLSAYKPGHYVYCDFYMAGEHVRMSDCSNLKDDDAHHLINCVMHRDIFKQTGGFDESRHLEDTRFWARCLYLGVCGIRYPEPLVEYTGDGQRSKLARSDPQWIRDYWQIFREYPSMCKSCSTPQPAHPEPGVQYAGDVLVITLWGGNRGVTGQVTRRQYPRSGNYAQIWMDPRDAAARPDLFQVVPKPIPPEPNIDIIAALTQEKLNHAAPRDRASTVSSETPVSVDGSHDKRESAERSTGNTSRGGQRPARGSGNAQRITKGRNK